MIADNSLCRGSSDSCCAYRSRFPSAQPFRRRRGSPSDSIACCIVSRSCGNAAIQSALLGQAERVALSARARFQDRTRRGMLASGPRRTCSFCPKNTSDAPSVKAQRHEPLWSKVHQSQHAILVRWKEILISLRASVRVPSKMRWHCGITR